MVSTETYTYDASGNITSENLSNSSHSFTYEDVNCLATAGNKAFNVDSRGRICKYPLRGLTAPLVNAQYDIRNRLTNVSGGTYSYLYDAENNRVNMYASSTNTMYTYDTSDGRNRLIWSKDEQLKVTTYAYGADGLMWSLCEGEFRIYHYDYRGSVVAVTDIDGNITDTVRYNAYGGVKQRTGTSKLIFGYNGKYGVLTDPNRLLYMRTRYYSPDLKRFMTCDILEGSIAESTSLNQFTFVNGNPVSFVDPFGMSAERGYSNNANIISGLQGLYGLAYGYYDTPDNDGYVQRYANDAVLKFIISKRFYNADAVKGLAWNVVGGPIDSGAQKYLEQFHEYDYLKEIGTVFIDPSSGAGIDFGHMMATLSGHYYYTFSLEDNLDSALNDYVGWAGDLITLAGNVQERYNLDPNLDIVQTVMEILDNSNIESSFSHSDLLGDIDAFLMIDYMYNTPIYEAVDTYYGDSYKSRYSLFLNKGFNGNQSVLESSAVGYLSPSLLTFAFKEVFQSSYTESVYPDVAKGFAEYIAIQAGR